MATQLDDPFGILDCAVSLRAGAVIDGLAALEGR